MSINLEYYKTFYYVAKNKQISIAAEELFITQPAVSQTIRKLEEQLGCTLFVRNKNGMELTEEGKKLYEFSERHIETLDNLEYKFGKYKNLDAGRICIRTGTNIGKILLYDALEKFGKDYPNIQIELASNAVDVSVKQLQTGGCDIICTYFPYEIKNSNLMVTKLEEKEYVFATSKKYFKENNVSINNIEDFNKYSLIVPKKGSSIWNIYNKFFGEKIKSSHYEVPKEELKKEFIKRNMGIAFIIKDEIKKELADGEFIEIKVPDMKIKGAIGVITLKPEQMTFATKKFLEYLK